MCWLRRRSAPRVKPIWAISFDLQGSAVAGHSGRRVNFSVERPQYLKLHGDLEAKPALLASCDYDDRKSSILCD